MRASADDEPGAGRRRPLLTTSEGIHRGAFVFRDWIIFASIGLIWGSSFLFIAIGLESFRPGLVTWLRVLFGGAVLWSFPAARASVDREDRPRLIAISVLWVAIPFTLFPIAEQHLTSALTGLLNGSLPIVAAVVGAMMLRRLPNRAHLTGLAVGFLGIMAIALPAVARGSSEAIGVLQVLAAVACYGIAANIAAPLTQRYGSLPIMARMLGYAAVWTAPFGLWSIPGSSFAWGPMLATFALGALGTGLAFALMGSLVARVGTTRAVFAIYLVPVVAMVLGAVFRDEAIHAISVVGIALVIAGAILASRRDVTTA
jgi:drug/metabolite transporter (DMT)-like permease